MYMLYTMLSGVLCCTFLPSFTPLAPEHPRHENFFDQKLTIFFLNFSEVEIFNSGKIPLLGGENC